MTKEGIVTKMSELEMVIAECPYCGISQYFWCEEDALYKLSKHKCLSSLLDKELTEILARIIEVD